MDGRERCTSCASKSEGVIADLVLVSCRLAYHGQLSLSGTMDMSKCTVIRGALSKVSKYLELFLRRGCHINP